MPSSQPTLLFCNPFPCCCRSASTGRWMVSYSVWRRLPLVLRILKNVGLISGRDYGDLMERFASISIYRLIQHWMGGEGRSIPSKNGGCVTTVKIRNWEWWNLWWPSMPWFLSGFVCRIKYPKLSDHAVAWILQLEAKVSFLTIVLVSSILSCFLGLAWLIHLFSWDFKFQSVSLEIRRISSKNLRRVSGGVLYNFIILFVI